MWRSVKGSANRLYGIKEPNEALATHTTFTQPDWLCAMTRYRSCRLSSSWLHVDIIIAVRKCPCGIYSTITSMYRVDEVENKTSTRERGKSGKTKGALKLDRRQPPPPSTSPFIFIRVKETALLIDCNFSGLLLISQKWCPVSRCIHQVSSRQLCDVTIGTRLLQAKTL